MKKLIITLLFVTGYLFSVHGQVKNIDFYEFDLENGLHVILHQNNATPLVAISVVYHVGSKNEKPDRTGFAHFFEHLMFEGSENIKREQFFKLVQNAGGRNNAFTTFDKTAYFEVLPSNQLKLGFWLESERMLHAKISQKGVETQREVVKQERNQRLDNQPYGSFMEETFSHAYKKHPYRWTPIGSDQYIDQAKLEEFIEFYNTYYVPNNAVLSIAGDIEIEETKMLVKKYFGGIPKSNRDIRRPNVKEPPQKKEIRDTVYDNIQLPAVIQAYHIPQKGTQDFYALDMLTTVLSEGKSSRLYQKLVEEQEIANIVTTFSYPLEDPGLFLVLAITNAGLGPKELETAIDKAVEKVQKNLISEREFQKLQNQIEAEFYNNNLKMRNIALNLAEYYLFYDNTNLINTEIEGYRKMTREDLRRVANEYLTEKNRTVLYYLPKKSEQQ